MRSTKRSSSTKKPSLKATISWLNSESSSKVSDNSKLNSDLQIKDNPDWAKPAIDLCCQTRLDTSRRKVPQGLKSENRVIRLKNDQDT
jgi:hypothetical protein